MARKPQKRRWDPRKAYTPHKPWWRSCLTLCLALCGLGVLFVSLVRSGGV